MAIRRVIHIDQENATAAASVPMPAMREPSAS